MIRQAVVPAAGRGARLDRPDTPKPLVDVGGQPLVVRLLGQLADAGVARAVVVTGYAGPQVVRALTHHPALGALELVFVTNERWADGLASSILAAGPSLADEPFLVAMADHVFDAPLVAALVTTEPPADGAVALVDDRLASVFDVASAMKVRLRPAAGRPSVAAIGRTLARFDAVDAGLFAATPALLAALAAADAAGGGHGAPLGSAAGSAAPRRPPIDLADGVARLAATDRVRAIRVRDIGEDAAWDDVDTPAALVHAEMRLRDARRRSRLRPAAVTAPPPHRSWRFVTGRAVETEVLVGRGLVAAPERLPIVPPASASSPVFVLTDETVNRLYGDRFVGRLAAAGHDVHRIVMADGEESKTLANYTYLAERVLGRGIDERSVLVSLGGGAVCNVCGLLAATLYRGVDLVHVPTTLMAQCDAAISHKQGVNGARGKNLVGAYYAPRLIVVDVDVLATLEDALIPDGLAEVLKHALAQDPDYVDWLLAWGGDRRDPPVRDPDFLEEVVRRNIALKCALMATDPKELREGMVLQYGHTAGHPIEYLSGYRLWHGQSVAIGMMVAARVARLMGAADDRLVALHERLIARYGLPTRIPAGIRVPDILEAMRYNKRYLVEGTRMALLSGVGRLWSVAGESAIPVSDEVLRRALEQTLAAAPRPGQGHREAAADGVTGASDAARARRRRGSAGTGAPVRMAAAEAQ